MGATGAALGPCRDDDDAAVGGAPGSEAPAICGAGSTEGGGEGDGTTGADAAGGAAGSPSVEATLASRGARTSGAAGAVFTGAAGGGLAAACGGTTRAGGEAGLAGATTAGAGPIAAAGSATVAAGGSEIRTGDRALAVSSALPDFGPLREPKLCVQFFVSCHAEA